ncbi:AI-2E family transporter [Dongia sedimenti]|uniref:AI-2E family transporter n=1 Tax=Dongia sedimenti TaxID=3064282 RepID=A0ABU0YJZ6_9PROT|nr:AI-2E family transporter [Rhodospirillaceae bacterium R-7]
MTTSQQIRFWLIGLVVALIAVYLLRAILLPFVAGMAIAYFLDPACDKLEKWMSRTVATSVVTLVFALLIVLASVLIVPLLIDQLSQFLTALPDLFNRAHAKLLPYYASLQQRFGLPDLTELADMARTRMGSGLTWIGQTLLNVAQGGVAIANLLSLIFITPVVTFYLLRDWDRIVTQIDGLLPRQHAAIIRGQGREIDRTLAGFARGQATVCLVLATYYATALMIVGLPFGLVVGIAAGLLTFVPYLGAIGGFIIAMAIALINFDTWTGVIAVAAIFGVGQIMEGNVLTPKLVGDRVGLHPVWVIFALLAGGTLFGFLGLLLAVPTAAGIGVLVRFALSRYLVSPVYLGRAKAASAPVPPLVGIDRPEAE